jgi:hypothetical protein
MRPTIDPTLLELCAHESGHAVTAFLLGIPCSYALVEYDGVTRRGRSWVDYPEAVLDLAGRRDWRDRHIICLLRVRRHRSAWGLLCLRVLSQTGDARGPRRTPAGSGASASMMRLAPLTLSASVWRTRRLIEQNWALVMKVDRAVAKSRRLDGRGSLRFALLALTAKSVTAGDSQAKERGHRRVGPARSSPAVSSRHGHERCPCRRGDSMGHSGEGAGEDRLGEAG